MLLQYGFAATSILVLKLFTLQFLPCVKKFTAQRNQFDWAFDNSQSSFFNSFTDDIVHKTSAIMAAEIHVSQLQLYP